MASPLSEQTARDLNRSLAGLAQRIKELEANIERLVKVAAAIEKHLRPEVQGDAEQWTPLIVTDDTHRVMLKMAMEAIADDNPS